ncbi:MAG: hypothetical protein Q9218_008086, partial [Villophora microphyllina]
MGSDPTDHDKTLLQRLNALKQSSVSFENSASSQENTQNSDNDLAARFQKINAARKSDPDALIKSIAETPGSADDTPPSPTIEDLLADLGPEEQWNLAKDETSQIQNLLKEAKEALPTSSEPKEQVEEKEEARQSPLNASQALNSPGNQEKERPSRRASTSSSLNDDEEASLQLQCILDELSLEPTTTPPKESLSPITFPTTLSHSFPLDLPSTPATAPTSSTHDPFPAVPLDLPSVPKTLTPSTQSKQSGG